MNEVVVVVRGQGAEGAGNVLAVGVAVGSQVVTRVGICHPEISQQERRGPGVF